MTASSSSVSETVRLLLALEALLPGATHFSVCASAMASKAANACV